MPIWASFKWLQITKLVWNMMGSFTAPANPVGTEVHGWKSCVAPYWVPEYSLGKVLRLAATRGLPSRGQRPRSKRPEGSLARWPPELYYFKRIKRNEIIRPKRAIQPIYRWARGSWHSTCLNGAAQTTDWDCLSNAQPLLTGARLNLLEIDNVNQHGERSQFGEGLRHFVPHCCIHLAAFVKYQLIIMQWEKDKRMHSEKNRKSHTGTCKPCPAGSSRVWLGPRHMYFYSGSLVWSRFIFAPVHIHKGSGSHFNFCPRPCSSTCRWARVATHRRIGPHLVCIPCSHAHFGRTTTACVSSPKRLGCLHWLAHAAGHRHFWRLHI